MATTGRHAHRADHVLYEAVWRVHARRQGFSHPTNGLEMLIHSDARYDTLSLSPSMLYGHHVADLRLRKGLVLRAFLLVSDPCDALDLTTVKTVVRQHNLSTCHDKCWYSHYACAHGLVTE